MIIQASLNIATSGRGTYDITAKILRIVERESIRLGLCHIFIHHTSASLILCENADPTVRSDLETFMQKTVPDGDPMFRHTMEGIDDMPAHIRTILTQSNLTLPITDGRCTLGTWQGVFVWEHRMSPQQRKITITLQG